MSAFTRDEIIAQLVAQNIPRHMAERAADRELAAAVRPVGHLVVMDEASEIPAAVWNKIAEASTPVARAPIAWPVRLLLPWSYLVSDNDREEPYIMQTESGPRPARRKTKRCKEAQAKIAQLARGKIGDAAAAEIPLEITARVWLPNNQLRNDVANFSKATHDALEGIVYRNDNLLHWVHWLRVGLDVDAPRAEITITPLLPAQ